MTLLAEGVGSRLFNLRQQMSATQDEAGSQIDRSDGHISNVENKKTELVLSERENLATHLEVHPLYLLAGLTPEITELVDLKSRMEPSKRRMALKLFKLNLELMEIAKNWPSDTVNQT